MKQQSAKKSCEIMGGGGGWGGGIESAFRYLNKQ